MSSPTLAAAAPGPLPLSPALAVMPAAYEALRPFFNPRTQWGSGGAQGMLAYRTLKDHFPELSPQESFLMVLTARQLFRAGGDTR